MEAILAADPDKILIVLQGADPEPAKAQLEGKCSPTRPGSS